MGVEIAFIIYYAKTVSIETGYTVGDFFLSIVTVALLFVILIVAVSRK